MIESKNKSRSEYIFTTRINQPLIVLFELNLNETEIIEDIMYD